MALSISHVLPDTSEPVLDTTVGGILRDAAREAPDAVALIEGVADRAGRRRWTYAELLAAAERAALALRSRFEPGEQVAIWAPNIPEWVIVEFGAALAGVTLVTVNPAYKPAEVRYVLTQSQASGLLMVPEFRGNPMAAALESVRAELPALREVVDLTAFDGFLASGDAFAAAGGVLPEVTPDDAAQIQYTSGTTGFPKGARLSHRAITNNARLSMGRIGFGADDTWVNPMPMFHTAGCVVATLGPVQARGRIVLAPWFDPTLFFDLVDEEGGSTTLLVPTMLLACLEHPTFGERDLGTLRSVVSGGATVPAELVRRVEKQMGVTFDIVFGQTESGPVITQTFPSDAPEDTAGTLGRPLPQTEVSIRSVGDDEIVPIGAVGEICTRGYLVMQGYFEMPEATAAAISADGWLRTGDLGTMDERGYCRIAGRVKDMIIRGGENIYPREIEDLLFGHPAVADVAVVGIPDERWGESVVAFVRPAAAGTTAAVGELFDFCREHLASYKTPRTWVVVDQFPTTASGKIQKYVLRERLVGGEFPPEAVTSK
ncbi:MAG TPA: AMP-binding protein [Acidimicrobiia bacterium]|jgi:fatty-acyl-CoA synthase|nr:AMP-binding protein [Acidimicrobiia bacterium]